MSELTKDDIEAVERALLRFLVLARAARRVVEHALPDDNSDAGEDRVSATELLAMIEKEAGEALSRF
ncbi:hypothetical protein [Thiomonas sp. FB-6]|uniref:hypothetical protein n=1 Tax=Thiomonas sp. FB-6 TaxID=1158291 RepID=UPI000364EC71|nr:hypothetical protein [Thiomonas sp. FB-6]